MSNVAIANTNKPMFSSVVKSYPDNGYACVVNNTNQEIITRFRLDIDGLALCDQVVQLLNQSSDAVNY